MAEGVRRLAVEGFKDNANVSSSTSDQSEWSPHLEDQDLTSWRMAQRSPQELFHEAAQQGILAQPQPWWKIQLFMWEPVLFGTWDGVFTSCMINIFGVVLFLRTGWLVGNTGVLLGLLLVSFVILVALITVLSGIGVAEHGGIGSGGVYSMISSVLGGQMGGTVGLLYVFGQCVAGAMYITGFAESISDLLGLGNIWAVRGISVAVLLALLGINLAGVKWIIRLQLLLLFLLAVSTLDFVVGSFTHLDPAAAFLLEGMVARPDGSTHVHCIAGRELPHLGGGKHFCHFLGFPDKAPPVIAHRIAVISFLTNGQRIQLSGEIIY
ncbi:Solute carrier family 12 member 8 [Microtus ochrogaster]|uniref:Solute carrier family 12 member 8 n=1 Tax=Microtus ochrogaster TaxID=79684 RepID=A0A8J6KVJ9_MICOH|nr:Solute carrier family 12 member 8 [Microtus ochrogaster]